MKDRSRLPPTAGLKSKTAELDKPLPKRWSYPESPLKFVSILSVSILACMFCFHILWNRLKWHLRLPKYTFQWASLFSIPAYFLTIIGVEFASSMIIESVVIFVSKWLSFFFLFFFRGGGLHTMQPFYLYLFFYSLFYLLEERQLMNKSIREKEGKWELHGFFAVFHSPKAFRLSLCNFFWLNFFCPPLLFMGNFAFKLKKIQSFHFCFFFNTLSNWCHVIDGCPSKDCWLGERNYCIASIKSGPSTRVEA